MYIVDILYNSLLSEYQRLQRLQSSLSTELVAKLNDWLSNLLTTYEVKLDGIQVQLLTKLNGMN